LSIAAACSPRPFLLIDDGFELIGNAGLRSRLLRRAFRTSHNGAIWIELAGSWRIQIARNCLSGRIIDLFEL
jgi:hypothetical protein